MDILSTSDSFRAQVSVWVKANKQKIWDLKKNEGKAEQSITTSELKMKKKSIFGTCTPSTTSSPEQPTFHGDTLSCIWSPHRRFLPQLFSYSHFFKGRLKHDDISCCSLGALGCVCSCVQMCAYTCPSLFFCCTCSSLGGLCMLLPRKKLLMLFPPQSEMEPKSSAVLGLACSYPNDTCDPGRKPIQETSASLWHDGHCFWNVRLAWFVCKKIRYPSSVQS